MTTTEARFRRRPRDPDDGWEVLLDGAWRDCRDAGTPEGDRILQHAKEDSSLVIGLEEAYPKGLLLSATSSASPPASARSEAVAEWLRVGSFAA